MISILRIIGREFNIEAIEPMSSNYYRQCRMKKAGRDDQVAWVPESYAVRNKTLRLKDDDGWVVMGVGVERLPEHRLVLIRDAYRTSRQVTDV